MFNTKIPIQLIPLLSMFLTAFAACTSQQNQKTDNTEQLNEQLVCWQSVRFADHPKFGRSPIKDICNVFLF